MDSKTLENLYQEKGKFAASDPTPFSSRGEWNQAIDYCTARAQGHTPEEASQIARILDAKFASVSPSQRVETATERAYRELRENCDRTRFGGTESA
jgi:hypothetical protein